MQKIFTIYCISCTKNDKKYIGFTSEKNPKNRFRRHKLSSKTSNFLIHKAMRKYGLKNFSFKIIYQSYDEQHTLNIMEPYFIKLYDSFGKNGYNQTQGGDGFLGLKNWSAEKRIHFRKNFSGQNSNAYKHLRKHYRLTHINSDGTTWTNDCLGLKNYAENNGYNQGGLQAVLSGSRKFHKDIVKVEHLNI